MSFTALLRRGAAAGAAAGLAAAAMAWLVLEPVIRRALAVEEARAGAHGHAEEPLVSRSVQVVGGLVTTALVALLLGVIFAVVFAALRHRLPAGTDLGRAVLLAGLGFGVFSLLPGLKYPANPPAVGDPGTVTDRTLLYVLAILAGALVVAASVALNRLLGRMSRPWPQRVAVVALGAAAVTGAVFAALPSSPDAVPSDVPPTLLWDFRLASLGQLATMWGVLGLVFGLLTETGARVRHHTVGSAA